MYQNKSKIRRFINMWLVAALCACAVISLPFLDRLSGVVILDGGTGSEIRARGLPFNETDWSAKILMENRLEDLAKIHIDYIKSGADVITTNTYGIALPIGEAKLLKDGELLVERAIKAAVIARDSTPRLHGGKVKIAGSVSPMFGSYRPDLFDEKKANSLYKITILPLLKNDDVDFLIFETTSSFQEMAFFIQFVNEAMRSIGKQKPYWISFALNDDAPVLRSGENIDSIPLLFSAPTGYQLPEAVLFNCSQPEIITLALKELRGFKLKVMLGGYANRFVKSAVDGEKQTPLRDISEAEYLKFVKEWRSAGASIMGGCCGVGPSYIAKISKFYSNRKGLSSFGVESGDLSSALVSNSNESQPEATSKAENNPSDLTDVASADKSDVNMKNSDPSPMSDAASSGLSFVAVNDSIAVA